MYEDIKSGIDPFDEDDIDEIKYYRTADGKIKIVFYFSVACFRATLRIGDKVFVDGFNDKEPYDNNTHFFYVPEELLTAESELLFTAEDAFEDGDLLYIELTYGEPEFADRDALLAEYNSHIETVKEETEVVCDGVVYSHMLCEDKNNAPVHMFLLEVDSSKASLYVGTPDDGYDNVEVCAKVPEMINSAVKNGHNAVAAVNADFFDIFGNKSPSGLCVKNGRVVANADSSRPFIGIKKDGTPLLTTLTENPDVINELDCAAAGLEMIVKDGKIFEWGELEPFSYVRHPRTAAGLTKDGKILLLVVDGRIPDYSNGATLVDLADFMISRGADRALNLDGGGSSVIYTKRGAEFVLHSNPADLFRPFDKLIRDEFNCIIVTK
ncbi:MAG: phosphodiester glycosidase family protein [Clostridia bacterium]|nr:phosphodiester glycosidase family protein [Clostridia bacterium]